MNRATMTWITLCLVVIGCGPSDTPTDSTKSPQDATTVGFLLDQEPDDAIAVGTARTLAKDGQEVTIVGIIGGSAKPFVEGLAAFTIVDEKVPYCADEEGCPTPWDYCCTQDQVKENLATVKLVNAEGLLVEKDAQEVLGVKELATVVVSGTAQRDAEGNLSIAATRVFVRP